MVVFPAINHTKVPFLGLLHVSPFQAVLIQKSCIMNMLLIFQQILSPGHDETGIVSSGFTWQQLALPLPLREHHA